MTASRPGAIAVRAVNQYRRRDPVPYLALRYYLCNAAARADYWAQSASTGLVLARADPIYFRALHFKDFDDDGKVNHRRISLPGANEALAEAALLDQCSNLPAAFANPPCVFSYELSQRDDRLGVFQPYFGGLQRRHQAIAEACDKCPNGIVRCVDIRRFYPSITSDVALAAWRGQADLGHLPALYRDLGERLIRDHDKARDRGERGILTGPMFSHLLGNLVLRQVDIACSTRLPAGYFRYVDDITLVGERQAVNALMDVLSGGLAKLDLELHDESSPKTYTVGCSEWLEGRNDFRESHRPISWMTFIGDLKCFLLRKPEDREDLRKAFLSEGLRVPVRDYAGVIREAGYVEKVLRLARESWFRRNTVHLD